MCDNVPCLGVCVCVCVCVCVFVCLCVCVEGFLIFMFPDKMGDCPEYDNSEASDKVYVQSQNYLYVYIKNNAPATKV